MGISSNPKIAQTQKVKGCPQFEVDICQNCPELNSDIAVLSWNVKSHSRPSFKINECEKHVRSNFDMVTLTADVSRTDKLKISG
jgi:hypothetical protein